MRGLFLKLTTISILFFNFENIFASVSETNAAVERAAARRYAYFTRSSEEAAFNALTPDQKMQVLERRQRTKESYRVLEKGFRTKLQLQALKYSLLFSGGMAALDITYFDQTPTMAAIPFAVGLVMGVIGPEAHSIEYKRGLKPPYVANGVAASILSTTMSGCVAAVTHLIQAGAHF